MSIQSQEAREPDVSWWQRICSNNIYWVPVMCRPLKDLKLSPRGRKRSCSGIPATMFTVKHHWLVLPTLLHLLIPEVSVRIAPLSRALTPYPGLCEHQVRNMSELISFSLPINPVRPCHHNDRRESLAEMGSSQSCQHFWRQLLLLTRQSKTAGSRNTLAPFISTRKIWTGTNTFTGRLLAQFLTLEK